jgi:hypothetical protein
LRAVASGLMIENVRSIGIKSSFRPNFPWRNCECGAKPRRAYSIHIWPSASVHKDRLTAQ